MSLDICFIHIRIYIRDGAQVHGSRKGWGSCVCKVCTIVKIIFIYSLEGYIDERSNKYRNKEVSDGM